MACNARTRPPPAEWRARSAANRAVLEQAVAAARSAGAGALVILFHADPVFERPVGIGFGPLFQDLTWLLQAFPGPILTIHGDSHQYILDHPMRDLDTGLPEPRLTRLVVPGSPMVAGVWVTYDPDAAEPFRFDRTYPELATDLVWP